MPRLRAGVRLALPLLLVLGALAGCKSKSEEDRVREVIQKVVDAANEKKPGQVVADALPSFRGPQNADLADCRRIVTAYLLAPGWVHVFVRDLEVTVDGETAKATLDTVLAQGKPVEKLEDLLPTNGDALTFVVELVQQDGEWKLSRATYRKSTGL